MVVAGAERFLGRGFVLFQWVIDGYGNEMKGYRFGNEFKGLSPVLTINDDF
jgi:hypothetical protein